MDNRLILPLPREFGYSETLELSYCDGYSGFVKDNITDCSSRRNEVLVDDWSLDLNHLMRKFQSYAAPAMTRTRHL